MLVSVSSTTIKALVPKFKRTVNDLRQGTYNPKSSQVLFNKNLCHYACAEFVSRLPEDKRKDYFWLLLGKGKFITHSLIADNKGIDVDMFVTEITHGTDDHGGPSCALSGKVGDPWP